MAALDFDQVIEQYHLALSEFFKGDSEPALMIFSQREEVSLANPFGPAVRGRKQVVETAERAASIYRDGEPVEIENVVKVVTPDFAFIVEVERCKAKVGGRQDLTAIALRATTIFRREDGGWKIVHRHADPIVSSRPVESIIPK
jgi:ketosteroid isomerase-like protein